MAGYLPYLHWTVLALGFIWLALLTRKLRDLRSRIDGETWEGRDGNLSEMIDRTDPKDREGSERRVASSGDLSGEADRLLQQGGGMAEQGTCDSHPHHQHQSLADAFRDNRNSTSRRSQEAEPDPAAEPTPAAPTPAPRPLQTDAPPPDPRLLREFNALASEPSAGALESFEIRWQPSRYRVTDGELLVQASEGELWFVPHDHPSPYGTILPGAEVVQTWDKFFRSLSGATAKQKLGTTYRLEKGPTLAVHEPCLGQRQDNGVRIAQPGRLVGL